MKEDSRKKQNEKSFTNRDYLTGSAVGIKMYNLPSESFSCFKTKHRGKIFHLSCFLNYFEGVGDSCT